MNEYTNVDVFYTLTLLAENLIDHMCAVEGSSGEYDPEDVTAVLQNNDKEYSRKILQGFTQAVYLMDMLTPDAIATDWLDLQQAREDFATVLRNSKRLARFWPSLMQDVRALEKVSQEKVRIYRQLMQPAYPNDLLIVAVPDKNITVDICESEECR